jgi:hypothetical protein
MANRSKGVLINPTWEQIVERDPLMAFSHYLTGRVYVLLTIADEIKENLDQGFSGQTVDGCRISRAESLMWLWVLGGNSRRLSRQCACPPRRWRNSGKRFQSPRIEALRAGIFRVAIYMSMIPSLRTSLLAIFLGTSNASSRQSNQPTFLLGTKAGTLAMHNPSVERWR